MGVDLPDKNRSDYARENTRGRWDSVLAKVDLIGGLTDVGWHLVRPASSGIPQERACETV